MNKDFRIKNIFNACELSIQLTWWKLFLYDMIWSITITFSADRNCTAWLVWRKKYLMAGLCGYLYLHPPCFISAFSPGSGPGPGRVSLCICTGKNDKMRYEKTNRNEKVILWQVKIFLLRGRAARACLCPTSLKEVTVFCRKIHKYLWLGNSVKAQIQRGFKPLNVRTGAIMLIIF